MIIDIVWLTRLLWFALAVLGILFVVIGAHWGRVTLRRAIGYIKQVFQFRPKAPDYGLRPTRHSRETHREAIGRKHTYPPKRLRTLH